MITLFNTLSGKKEPFKPIKTGKVSIYSCGPTVYAEQHIGNMRSMLLADLLIRMFEYNKYKVNHIINYTDVGHLTSDRDEGEDKIELAAKKEHLTAKAITQKYIDLFEKDIKKLNIELGKRVRATDTIKEQIELIKKLEKKDYTYKTSEGIYFNTGRFKSYGQLAGFGEAEIKAGVRIAKGGKKHNTDFALWKFSGEEKRLQEWDSPWGRGFPGWHIECSAMSMKYLGKHFDIHTGGQDLSQVHHNNEIAQSECATGKKFVNCWMHGGFLMYGGEKVSKSKGGLYTVSELESLNYDPLHYRYLCLLTHYKKPLNFSIENLEAAKNAYERLKRKIIEIKKETHKGSDLTKQYESAFLEAINDDLNIPKAMQVLWEAVDNFDFNTKKKIKLLEKFDSVLGLNIKSFKEQKIVIPEKVQTLVDQRESLRAQKKWAEADVIRERIHSLGFTIKDTPKGPELEKS